VCGRLRSAGLEIRVGLHAGGIVLRDDGDISGIAVYFAARVEQAPTTEPSGCRRSCGT
jgi:class 3 adenylate cyclase